MYDDKPLNDDLTLIDIAYIYAWRAKVLIFYFEIIHLLFIKIKNSWHQ
jgi:hypothetical protein